MNIYTDPCILLCVLFHYVNKLFIFNNHKITMYNCKFAICTKLHKHVTVKLITNILEIF